VTIMLGFSKENKKIRKAIANIKAYLVRELKDKGLISLYLAGTILSKEERVKDSDIDFFSIVEPGFDFIVEKTINEHLLKHREDICLGFECRFRAFTISSLKGQGDNQGVISIIRAERLVQRFPFFNQLWGKKIDFKKDFAKPMKLKDEAEFLIKQLRKNMDDVRRKKEKFPVDDFPKFVIELVRVEAQAYHGFKYHPARRKLQNHLREQKEHIIHKAMRLRENPFTRQELLSFFDEVDNYILYLENRLEKSHFGQQQTI
jgi:hypothetical protein